MKVAAMVVGLALVATACGGADGSSTPTASVEEGQVTRVEIEAFDFAFKVSPDPVPAGEIETVLTNEGKQPHQAMLYRVNDGVEFDDFKEQVMEDQTVLPQLAEGGKGGVTDAVGDGDSKSAAGDELTPGTYAVICWIRDQSAKTSKNHAELGMITRFEVE